MKYSWETHSTECPSCGYRFNFTHSRLGAKGASRYGNTWIFECPHCLTRQAFVMEEMKDESLPVLSLSGLPTIAYRLIAGITGLIAAIVTFFYAFANFGPNTNAIFIMALAVSASIVAALSAIYLIYTLEEIDERPPGSN